MSQKLFRHRRSRHQTAYPQLADSSLSLAQALTLKPFILRFAWAAGYFIAVFLIGTAGYVAIEGWGWFEALYMSVTTVTSVGFMEVHPLSVAGRYFTIVLVTLGVTGLGIWWALTTALIVELDLGGVMRRRRKMKELASLADHFVVCGAGRVGLVVVDEMIKAGVQVIVIERDSEHVVQLVQQFPDLLVLEGDATREQVLKQAGVAVARGLAACLADDGENLLVCLTARDLNPSLATVARAYNEESMDKLRRAGANHVISPTITGGIRMASSLIRPNVVSFLDSATLGADIDLRLEEAQIPEGSHLSGRSLADARIAQRTGLIVLALKSKRHAGRQVFNPGPDTRLSAGDVMIVLGHEEQVQQLREYARGGDAK